jgi:hypothetical protein
VHSAHYIFLQSDICDELDAATWSDSLLRSLIETTFQKLNILQTSLHSHHMSLLHDDFRALYSSVLQVTVQMLKQIWTHWVDKKISISSYPNFSTYLIFTLLKGQSIPNPLFRVQLEFTNVNCAICATIFETCLVIGTSPTNPILRLCTMPSSIICYYFGFLFLLTAFLSKYRYRLPFPMSSTPKGSIWRPALVTILEDAGAIEGRGELAFRQAVMRRYETSPLFRQMIMRLTWAWGFGFVVIATVSTILIMALEENIAFGVGWGLPYVWVALYSLGTVVFVKRSLREERKTTRIKSLDSRSDSGLVT